jgi:hypothetical protein
MVAGGFPLFLQRVILIQILRLHNIRGLYHNLEKIYTTMRGLYISVDNCHIGACLDESTPSSGLKIFKRERCAFQNPL